jgi:CRP-like cAMP-binding protein
MDSSEETRPGTGNRLLAQLSPESFARIDELGEKVSLRYKEVLFQPDERIEYVWFPYSGCLSMVALMDEDTAVEVGTIGFEGMAGIAVVLGVDTIPNQCVVQIAGSGIRVPRSEFEKELRGNGELATLLFRYAQVWNDQVGRFAACNAVHNVDERCARWLLMTHDRVGHDAIPLTQEFLAIMLGVRRSSVTLAASALQRAGLITYRRGKITILDRHGLEDASCSCYATIQASYDRLLGAMTTA